MLRPLGIVGISFRPYFNEIRFSLSLPFIRRAPDKGVRVLSSNRVRGHRLGRLPDCVPRRQASYGMQEAAVRHPLQVVGASRCLPAGPPVYRRRRPLASQPSRVHMSWSWTSTTTLSGSGPRAFQRWRLGPAESPASAVSRWRTVSSTTLVLLAVTRIEVGERYAGRFSSRSGIRSIRVMYSFLDIVVTAWLEIDGSTRGRHRIQSRSYDASPGAFGPAFSGQMG
jgi:hypothetical protein